jgi:enoyl-CoA hydratase/carnithine racemase
VPHDELLPRALALAAEIADNPAPQLRMIKQLLTRNGSATDLTDVQRAETALLRECWKSPEHHEAVRTFLEKARAKAR